MRYLGHGGHGGFGSGNAGRVLQRILDELHNVGMVLPNVGDLQDVRAVLLNSGVGCKNGNGTILYTKQ